VKTEIQHSVNKDIQAFLSGPHPIGVGFDTFLLSAHGISAADIRLLASWFSNPVLVAALRGKCGHVTTKFWKKSQGRTTVRIYADDDTYHELEILLPANIDYFATIGRYFGYRDCCAQYFTAMRENVVPKGEVNDNHLYGHCPQCVHELQPYDHKSLIKEINEKRICPAPFPNDTSNVWIRYRVYDAVFKGEMSFALLNENKFLQAADMYVLSSVIAPQ
jgi:hypothetical protein